MTDKSNCNNYIKFDWNRLGTLPDALVKMRYTIIDCAQESELSLGRLVNKIAKLLQGKDRIDYCAHRAIKDQIIVLNSNKIIFNTKNVRYKHTGYPGGLKVINYQDIISAKQPEKIRLIKQSLKNMLPRNKQRHQQLKNIKFFFKTPLELVNCCSLPKEQQDKLVMKQFRSNQ